MADNGILTATLLAQLKVDIRAAWGDPPIYYRKQKIARPANYAIIRWLPVAVSFKGEGASVSSPSQHNWFEIFGRFTFDPTSEQSDLLKITRANDLIALLQTGADYAGIGLLPLVTRVDPQDEEEAPEGTYDLTLTFECFTTAPHH
jgi:hypothetical protein